jgi:hypothetical protein
LPTSLAEFFKLEKLSTKLSTTTELNKYPKPKSNQGFIYTAEKVFNRLSTPCGLVSFMRINSIWMCCRQGCTSNKNEKNKTHCGYALYEWGDKR